MESDGIIELDLMTAQQIYNKEKDGSLWYIKEAWWIAKQDMFADDHIEDRIQNWQYYKALTKILKERGAWDDEYGTPSKDPAWMDLTIDTQEWREYFMAHPEDQQAMYLYKNRQESRRVLCLI